MAKYFTHWASYFGFHTCWTGGLSITFPSLWSTSIASRCFKGFKRLLSDGNQWVFAFLHWVVSLFLAHWTRMLTITASLSLTTSICISLNYRKLCSIDFPCPLFTRVKGLKRGNSGLNRSLSLTTRTFFLVRHATSVEYKRWFIAKSIHEHFSLSFLDSNSTIWQGFCMKQRLVQADKLPQAGGWTINISFLERWPCMKNKIVWN